MRAEVVVNGESYCMDLNENMSTKDFYNVVFGELQQMHNFKNNVKMNILHNGRIVRPSEELYLGDIVSEELPVFDIRYFENVRKQKLVLLSNGMMLLVD